MNIYRVTRKGEVGYDRYDSFIVAADNCEDARRLAQDAANKGEWHENSDFLDGSCEVIDLGEARVLLGSFRAG